MEERRIPGKMEKKNNMFYIHKKGEVDKEENYKGITLLNLAAKVYEAVLIERLRKKVEGKSYYRKHKRDLERKGKR